MRWCSRRSARTRCRTDPIVIRSSSQVEIRLLERPETQAQVTCDGVSLGELALDDKLVSRAGKHAA